MSLFRSIFKGVCLGTVLLSSAYAGTHPHISVQPQARVVSKIDNADVVLLPHSAPTVVSIATDKGRLASSTVFSHMLLVLKSSDEQELALRGLLDQQQDKSSPNYHQWMTPETFGASFGVASADLAKITAWLQDEGFSVDSVSASGRTVQFSGTSGQVENAFHTEMHTVMVNGVSHISNTVDLSVPKALSSVIAGVASLSDFRAKANAVNPHPLVKGTDGEFHLVVPGTIDTPDYTSTTSGSHYVAPADVATIYNAKPLLSSGIDGTGVTIAVIGQSSINLSNVETFRSMFRLPVNDPTVINVGPPPAIISDDIESDLDVEWAGALATAAKIKFYTASISFLDGGVDTSALEAVDKNGADIISLSYGGCELSNGSAGTAYWNSLWQQAAAQGQTAFVSTGDSNATGCASSSATLANTSTTGTYAVNALGSSAYNVAVGGSEFNEGTATGVTSYWGAGGTPPYGTALSYIPETVWNEGAFAIVVPGTGVAGGGGGVSIFTGRPSWQLGPGITATDPAGPTFTASGAIPASQLHRLVPDVSLIAAGGHDGTIFCSEGVCKIDSAGNVVGIGVVGGTSVATPVMAGVQALINQKNGGRQGNANYYYYKLAAAQTTANCASTLPPAASCNFNDIVTGNNFSPKTSTGKYNASTGTISGTLGTDYIGFSAGTGFDVATGLGTPNITNLANNWSTVTFNATTTTLSLTPTSITHGATQTAVITVAPTSATGTPTGDVSLTAVGQSAGASDGNVYHLSGGTVTAAIKNLPGGTYSVTAHYAGDAVYGSSDSAPVTVTIVSEASLTFITPYNITTAGAVNAATTFTYGTSIYLDTEVQGSSASAYNGNNVLDTGAPTGTITYAVTSGSTVLTPYISNLDTYGTTYLEIGQSFANFLIYANYPALSPAAYGVKATYSGDSSFKTSNASTAFTVVKATVVPVLRAGTVQIASGATALLNVTIAASGGGVLPTGSVTLTDTTTSGSTTSSQSLGSVTLTNGAAVLSTNAITTSGAHSITASYGGDANYNSSTSAAAAITVGGTASSTTLTATVGGTAATTAPLLTAVVLTATPPSTATGTVYFYDGALVLGSATINTSTHLATLSVATLTAGTHSITATYAGNTTLATSTSTPIAFVTTQNKPTLSLTSQQTNNSSSTVSMNAVLTLVPVNAAVASPAPSVPVQFLDGTTAMGTSALVYTLNYHTYAAAFTGGPLKPGPHVLTAVFPGDTNYATATSGVQNVNIGLTSIVISSSSMNVGVGTTFTLSAKITPDVASSTGVGGSVTFYDGTTVLGTATVAGGIATLNSATLTGVSSHTITAVYSGDANFYTSTTTTGITITVSKVPTTIAFTVSPSTVGTGTTFTLAAKVTPTSASSTALSGSVTFYDGATSLGTATVSAGIATLNTATLTGISTHTITAVYSGDDNFTTSTTSPGISIVVSKVSTTVVVTPSSLNVGTGTAFTLTATVTPTVASSLTLSGTATFYDGATVLGTGTVTGGVATLNPASLIGVSTHTVTAVYSGDANFNTSTSPGVSIVVSKVSTTIAIRTSATNVGTGTPFTLTATVTPVVVTSVTVGGTVTFYDGTTVIGTAPVTGGTATLATATLSGVATHTVTAVYAGDASFLTSTTSAGVSIVAVVPGFFLSVNPGSLTITRGSTGSITMTIVSYGNYSGSINFTCQNLPVNTLCNFNNGVSSVTFAGLDDSRTVTLTVTTLATTKAGVLWLPAVLLAALLGLGRRRLSVQGRRLVVLALMACGMMAASGCGSGDTTGTPLGVSTFVIVANGTGTGSSPSIAPTTSVVLTVQ